MSRYLVWNEDESRDDAREISHSSAEWAAEEWAEKDDYNSAEYSIANGSTVIVSVEDVETGKVERFKIRGEYEPAYYAYEVL